MRTLAVLIVAQNDPLKFKIIRMNYRTRAKIRAGLFETHAVLDALITKNAYFRAMLIQNFH